MPHAELDRGLEVAELGAAVEAPPRQAHRERALLREQRRDAVGELDLAAGAWRHLREHLEDPIGEDVAPDHREVGRRVLRLGLLDDAVDARRIALYLVDGDDA